MRRALILSLTLALQMSASGAAVAQLSYNYQNYAADCIAAGGVPHPAGPGYPTAVCLPPPPSPSTTTGASAVSTDGYAALGAAIGNVIGNALVQLFFGPRPSAGPSAAQQAAVNQASALNNEGVAAFQRGDYASATSYFQQASQLLPNEGSLRRNLLNAQSRERLQKIDRLSESDDDSSDFQARDEHLRAELAAASTTSTTTRVGTSTLPTVNAYSQRAATDKGIEHIKSDAMTGFDTGFKDSSGAIVYAYPRNQAPAILAQIPQPDRTDGVMKAFNYYAHLDGLAHDNSDKILEMKAQQAAGNTDPLFATRLQTLVNQQNQLTSAAMNAQGDLTKEIQKSDQSFRWTEAPAGSDSSQPASPTNP